MSEHGASSTLSRRALGLGFVVLVLGALVLSYASYAHWLRDFTTVTLKTDKVGNQLGLKSDVKARGVIVGYVAEIQPTAEGADLTLRLEPDKADLVPRDTSARILPKTLFGERFISLEFDSLDGAKLAEGDVIPQDRSKAATELSKMFEKLLPVLEAVQPEKLNSTLSAISTALSGKGTEIGKTLNNLGKFMGELNPHVPKLERSLKELSRFAGTAQDVTPDLVQALDNLRTTSRTLVDKQADLDRLYRSVTTTSGDVKEYLEQNKNNLITVNKVSKDTLNLLEKYSPQLPCVSNQMARAVPRINKVFGKGTSHPALRVDVKIVPSRPKYEPNQDEPANGNLGGKDSKGKDWGTYSGPWCLDPLHPEVPDPLPYPVKMIRFQDGTKPRPDPRSAQELSALPCDAVTTYGNKYPDAWDDGCEPGTKPDGSGITHGELGGNTSDQAAGGGGAAGGDGAMSINTPEENRLLDLVVGAQQGSEPGKMADWGSLMVGPLYRGAEVNFDG